MNQFALMLVLALGRDQFDIDLTRLMRTHNVPGMQIAILQGSETVRYANYGFAEIESKRLVMDDTRFEVASVTKIFTGLAIRMLLNDGKLRLNTRVSDLLPLSQRWAKLEIRHLIGMTMGLGDDWDSYKWGHIKRNFSRRSTLAFFDTMPQLFPIGTKHEYCSPAYAMLGMIIEKLTGKHFSRFFDKRIFAVAGMKNSMIMNPGVKQPKKATGYRFDGNQVRPGYSITAYLHGRADVGLLTTAKDLANFVIALDRKMLVSNPNVLWQSLKTNNGSPAQYGYGWYVDNVNNDPYYYHGGLFRTGFRSMLMRFPKQSVTVIVATNNSDAPIREFVRAATHCLFPEIVVPD